MAMRQQYDQPLEMILDFPRPKGLVFSLQLLETLKTECNTLFHSIQGHGLSLTIVRDIIERYGGCPLNARRKLGGLCGSVQLPNGWLKQASGILICQKTNGSDKRMAFRLAGEIVQIFA